MKSGVYKITNKKTGKIYIGSSSNIVKRWRTHQYDLLKNKHHSPLLQRVYNKYGKDELIFEVIEYCEDYLEKEQYYQEIYNVFDNSVGLNLRKIDQVYIKPYTIENPRRGWKHTQETKDKMSLSKKGHNYLSKEHYKKLGDLLRGKKRDRSIPEKMKETLRLRKDKDRNYKKHRKCYLYYKDSLQFFKEFESANDLIDFLRLENKLAERRGVYRAIKNNFTLYGYYVSFEKTEIYKFKGKKFNKEYFILQLDKTTDNIIDIFISSSYAARSLGLKGTSGILSCCSGKRNFCKNSRWKYLKDIDIEAYGSDAIRKLGEFEESLEAGNFKPN